MRKFNFSYIIQLVRQVWKSLFASFCLFEVDNDIPARAKPAQYELTFRNLEEYKKLQNQKSKEKIWKINHIMENIGKAFLFFLFADVYVGLMVYSNFKLFLPMIYYVNFWQRKVVSCVVLLSVPCFVHGNVPRVSVPLYASKGAHTRLSQPSCRSGIVEVES